MKLKIKSSMALLVLTVWCAAAGEPPAETTAVGLPLTGQAAITFLRTAKVVGAPEAFDPLAVTSPLRVTLSTGDYTLRAVFKDADTLHRTWRFGDGREVGRVRDSYKHEIAAFELDLMLGLGLVPPCVERTIDSKTGSLCLWIEDAMTEDERRDRRLEPPDENRFRGRMREARLFQQLIADLDYSNVRNIVVDTDFQIYKVDSSMAFYPDSGLIGELDSSHVSRRFFGALRTLDKKALTLRLERWLLKAEISSLWARRTRILKRIDRLVSEQGPDVVFY